MRDIIGKNCLNCKYEPDWSAWTTGEYERCSGKCKWDKGIPILPAIYRVSFNHIIRYRDDSGIETRCKTWEPKPNQAED